MDSGNPPPVPGPQPDAAAAAVVPPEVALAPNVQNSIMQALQNLTALLGAALGVPAAHAAPVPLAPAGSGVINQAHAPVHGTVLQQPVMQPDIPGPVANAATAGPAAPDPGHRYKSGRGDPFKRVQGMNYSEKSLNSPDAHLDKYEIRLAPEATEEDKVLNLCASLRAGSQMVGWLSALPDKGRKMTWAELKAAFIDQWGTKVRKPDILARSTLLSNGHRMQRDEDVLAYTRRFKRLLLDCPELDMKTQCLLYLNGLPAVLKGPCQVDSTGADWTSLDALLAYAAQREHRMLITGEMYPPGGRPKGRPSAAAVSTKQVKGSTPSGGKRARAGDSSMELDDEGFTLAAASKRSTPQKKRGTPKGSAGPAGARSEEWKRLCNDHKLCGRCGEKGHWVRACTMDRSAPQPGGPNGKPPGLSKA